jgi:hypothetical protein
MRVVIFFGLLSTLVEYLTIRLYHVNGSQDESFCTINILNTVTKSERRWKLNIKLQSFMILLELMTRELPLLLADVLNSTRHKKTLRDIEGFSFIFESNYECVINENNLCPHLNEDCCKFLNLLKMLQTAIETERLLECHVIISHLLEFSKNLFIFSNLFNNFVYSQLLHLFYYFYMSKKANKIWNREMRVLSLSLIKNFSAFDKKIV